jgi:uncharacterized membrane protein
MKLSKSVSMTVGIGALCAVLILGVLAVLTYGSYGASGPLSFLVDHHLEIMVLLVLAGLATGSAAVYLLATESKHNKSAAAGTAELLLSFISSDERETVLYLAQSSVPILQSQLATAKSYSAVRVHRIVGRLQQKQFITLERYGKTNKLVLAPQLRDALQ